MEKKKQSNNNYRVCFIIHGLLRVRIVAVAFTIYVLQLFTRRYTYIVLIAYYTRHYVSTSLSVGTSRTYLTRANHQSTSGSACTFAVLIRNCRIPSTNVHTDYSNLKSAACIVIHLNDPKKTLIYVTICYIPMRVIESHR